jgi:hypothetical protein
LFVLLLNPEDAGTAFLQDINKLYMTARCNSEKKLLLKIRVILRLKIFVSIHTVFKHQGA